MPIVQYVIVNKLLPLKLNFSSWCGFRGGGYCLCIGYSMIYSWLCECNEP